MEFLENLSYLQIFWGAQTVFVILCTVYYIVTGGFWDKTQGERDPSEPVGLLKFRKRTGLLTFLGFLWTAWIFWNAVSYFCWATPPNDYLQKLLQTAAVPERETTDATCTLLAAGFFLLHVFQRLYECAKICIFSRRQAVDPITLILMYAFYAAAGLSLVAEAPESLAGGRKYTGGPCFQLASVKWPHAVALIIFLWASKLQLDCFQTLARLRRNKAGHIVTTGYKIPNGHWFDSVSSPHYFAELLIYVSIGLVLGLGNATWWWLVAFVASYQFFLAYNTHAWYLNKFQEDYPKDRKIFIPMVL